MLCGIFPTFPLSYLSQPALSDTLNLLVFPHQLFINHPGLKKRPSRVVMIEDSLFFGDSVYPAKFHKQKLWLHRATMKRYQEYLDTKGWETLYVDYDPRPQSLLRQLEHIRQTMTSTPQRVLVADPTDFILSKRLERFCHQVGLKLEILPTPQFINTSEENQDYRAGKKRWFMADFYKFQRKRLGILVDADGQPEGGKWSFDAENRKKVPKKMLDQIPAITKVKHDSIDDQVKHYVEKTFPDNPGNLNTLHYPTSHTAAKRWLKQFLTKRFDNFGPYEDAIVQGESWLWHSVLTPMLNTGLLTPEQVVKETVSYAGKHDVPLASLEGFLRQIIGWREFIRATYEDLGVEMRTTNHWKHERSIPASFYDGTTGIDPIDDTIGRILDTGYCHHIERLMVLGGFMFLCEFHPDEIYRWFMEMFIDSYDWVMVPNAYAMSQHADGGLITTKPYFSGSAYIRKMSHYKPCRWSEIWDGLYWRWVWNHSEELAKNPRWAMMCSMARKMDQKKRSNHIDVAKTYMAGL